MDLNFYEDLSASARKTGSSDRQFGLVFTLAFAALGLWPLRAGGHARARALAIAGLFLVVALLRPAILLPLNKTWTLLGLLLGRVVNPVVTALLFFLVFTPAGLISRWLGKDPLRLKSDPAADTYWINRQPPGPHPETMSRQF